MTEKSIILQHEADRAAELRPNPRLDRLIGQLRAQLEPLQRQCDTGFAVPPYPVVGVVGCSRSGSTLLTQLLAATGEFCYPTNFLSRFAYAPYIGAMIQQMLFDPEYDFLGELSDIKPAAGFSSSIGKTQGALNVNEFHHFWRRFSPVHDQRHLAEQELASVDLAGLRAEIAAIETVFGKPFMAKVKMMQFNLQHFAERLPELFILHIRREPRYVMQSLLLARRKTYGRDDIWLGGMPQEYGWLSQRDSYQQVAGQVLFTERAIAAQLDKVAESAKLQCRYEALCADPAHFYAELRGRLRALGGELGEYRGPPSFPCANRDQLPHAEIEQLEAAYRALQSN